MELEETNSGYYAETVPEDEEYKINRDILSMLETWQPGPALLTTKYDWPIRVVKGIVAD